VPRRAVVLVAAAAAAVGLRLVLAVPAEAWNPARDDAVATLGRLIRAAGPAAPGDDYTAIRAAWAAAGLNLRRADARLAADRGGPGEPVTGFFAGVCAPAGLLHLPDDRPRPGDLAAYPARGGTGGWRLAMFVSAEDLVGLDPATGRLDVMPRQAALPDDGSGNGSAAVVAGVCRVDPALMPGGADSDTAPAGRVALVDPGVAAGHIDWAAEHPRDADTSLVHRLAGAVVVGAAALSSALGGLVGVGLAGAAWVLRQCGPAGAIILAEATFIAGILGTHFDGRRLHAVLTAVLVGTVGLLLLGPGAALLGVMAATSLLGGAAVFDVPVLGRAGRLLWSVAGFVTTVVTGVDDNDHASVGEVVVALVADALVWGRPALLALRAGALAGRLESVLIRVAPGLARSLSAAADVAGSAARVTGEGLGAAGSVADAVVLRPHALANLGRTLLQLVRGGAAGEVSVETAPLTAGGGIRRLLGTAVDMVSSGTWRRSSAASDLLGHGAAAAGWLRADLAAGGHSWTLQSPMLRDIVARVPATRRAAIVDVVLPQVRDLGTLSHLHSGAHTVSTLAAGQPLPTLGDGGNPAVSAAPPIKPRVQQGYAGPG